MSLAELLRYAAMRGGSMDLPSETLQALDVATKHSLAIRKGWHLVGRSNNLVFPPQVCRPLWASNRHAPIGLAEATLAARCLSAETGEH